MSTWIRRLALSGGLALAAFDLRTHAGPGHRLPESLKTDLKAAWAQPDGQRVAALQSVLDKAVSGAYGEQAATRATKVKARLAAMNPQLRSDLLAAIERPKDQRRAALKQIKAKAQAGEYRELKGRNGRLPGLLRHRG